MAAAHIHADAIIHFGPVCFSATSGNIPYLLIYEKHSLDINNFKLQVQELVTSYQVVIVLDTSHYHQFGNLDIFFNFLFDE